MTQNLITNNIIFDRIKKYLNKPKIVCLMFIRGDIIIIDIVLTHHQYITYLKPNRMLSKLPST